MCINIMFTYFQQEILSFQKDTGVSAFLFILILDTLMLYTKKTEQKLHLFLSLFQLVKKYIK